VSFDLWVSSDFVTNSGFDRWGFAERIPGGRVGVKESVSVVYIADSHSQSTPNDGSENCLSKCVRSKYNTSDRR
jgi:hypothetical protein